MSTAENTIKEKSSLGHKVAKFGERAIEVASSVRLGVILLCILVALSMIGMLIVQQNVNGFDAYFVSLTPAEKSVYGTLGFFDIYHSWYFNFLLLFLSLNIILASIDRFPSAWSYISDPMKTPTRGFLQSQTNNAKLTLPPGSPNEIETEINEIFAANGFKPITSDSVSSEYAIDENGRKDFTKTIERTSKVIFGESGRINRLGAYIVHVALLTLFLGHFVALRTGFDADVRMVPGAVTDEIQLIEFNLDKKERYNVKLPFSMECTDIQQRLIDADGGIDVTNTMDWRTQMRIDDPIYGTQIFDVSLNSPINYRGYRFFQAQTIPVGSARVIKLELTPQNGGAPLNVEIPRNGSITTADGMKIDYVEFQPDFTFGPDGKPSTRSGDFNNPVAVLNVTPAGGEVQRVFAFAQKLADNMPVGAPKVGYKWRLAEFEKAPYAHVLSIKYDPFSAAFVAWYFGGFGLCLALCFVFFFSHRRVWARIEKNHDGSTEILIAGNANRNPFGFDDKFGRLVNDVKVKFGSI